MRVYFEDDRYIVSETDGKVELCVRREGDLSGSLTIHIATEELIPPQAQSRYPKRRQPAFWMLQCAIFPSLFIAGGRDYIDLHPELQILSFQPNEDRICFEVSILDDQLREGEENFTARIVSVPTGVVIGNPETTIISITDDESKLNIVVCNFVHTKHLWSYVQLPLFLFNSFRG